MADLFELEAPPKRLVLNSAELHAREQLGMSDHWEVYLLESLPKTFGPRTHISVTGAVCTAVYLSGKRKGQTNWTKLDKATERTAIFSVTEHEAWIEHWESINNICLGCSGTGQELASVSVKEGAEYRPCHKCRATGKPLNKFA